MLKLLPLSDICQCCPLPAAADNHLQASITVQRYAVDANTAAHLCLRNHLQPGCMWLLLTVNSNRIKPHT
jgi:hypothetical protein